MDAQYILDAALCVKDTIQIDLHYPALPDSIKHFQIGLIDVRAADDIRVSYNFERNGWKIEQPSICEWKADDKVCDQGWTEVAFIPARFHDPRYGTNNILEGLGRYFDRIQQ